MKIKFFVKALSLALIIVLLLPSALGCKKLFGKGEKNTEGESQSQKVTDVIDDTADTKEEMSDTSGESDAVSDVIEDTSDVSESVADTSEQTEDTSDLYDESGYLKDTVPELDFDGYEFKMLSWNSGYDSDFFAELDVGDTIIDAVYFRNEAVKKRLNIELSANFIDGNNAKQAEFVAAATNAIIGGGVSEYDLIGSYSMCGGTLASQGLLCDLNTLDYLDFDNPWWSQSLVEMSTIKDKLYFVTGDLSNAYLYNMYCMVLNKNLVTEYELSDPREMVEDGTWTLDVMMEMTKNVGSDEDDVAGKSEGDRFGFVSYGAIHMDCFLAASGIRMAEENNDGVLQLTEDFTGNKMHGLVTKINDWFYTGDDCVLSTNFGYRNIRNGNALFGAVAFSTVDDFQEADWEYALLPYPKAYEDQENYYTNLGFGYTNFSIPITVDDADRSAAVLECMNSEAHRTSTPILYEKVLKSRYSNDVLDKKMYDIIRESVYVDVNRIFSSSFVWADSAVALFRNSLTRNNSNWISTIGAKKDSINGILANISASITG